MDNAADIIDPTKNRTRSPDYRDIYANECLGRISPFDISITFAQAKHTPDGTLNEEQATVTLSPQQFKLLAALCANISAAYEQSFGAINLPTHLGNPKMSVTDIVKMMKTPLALLEQRAEAVRAAAAPTSSPTERKRPAQRKLIALKKKAT